MILNATNKTLEVLLAGVAATNQLPVTVCYTESTDSSGILLPAEMDVATNNTTAVTALSAPASGKRRIVDSLFIHNSDTAAATVTVQLNNAGTIRKIRSRLLLPNESLSWSRLGGWFDPTPVATVTAPIVLGSHCGGRLSATSASPLSTAAITAATSIHLVPFISDRVVIYDGANKVEKAFTTISKALTGLSATTSYYAYLFWTGSALDIEISTDEPVWNATVGMITRPSAPTRLYLGAFVTTSAGAQVDDKNSRRCVASFWNPQQYIDWRRINADTWAVTNVWRSLTAVNSEEFQHQFVIPWAGIPISADLYFYQGLAALIGVGIDGVNPGVVGNRDKAGLTSAPNSGAAAPVQSMFMDYPVIGKHSLELWDISWNGAAATVFGDNNMPAVPTNQYIQSGWRVIGQR